MNEDMEVKEARSKRPKTARWREEDCLLVSGGALRNFISSTFKDFVKEKEEELERLWKIGKYQANLKFNQYGEQIGDRKLRDRPWSEVRFSLPTGKQALDEFFSSMKKNKKIKTKEDIEQEIIEEYKRRFQEEEEFKTF